MNISHFRQLDWDFPEQNSRKFLHNMCWYPSRFIPMIPAQLIASLSRPGDTIFDPFCGSGTVLIEALRQHRNVVCLDINPLGCFIARTKAKISSGEYFDLAELKNLLGEIELVNKEDQGLTLFQSESELLKHSYSEIPNQSQIAPWYHERTFEELISLFNYIEHVEHELTRDILRLLFISILIASSGHKGGRPYTYYADNVKPKIPLLKNALKLYGKRLRLFLSEYNDNVPLERLEIRWDVINGDARNISEELTDTVDLIVTSPPYVSVTDYSTAFRLAHLWYEWNDSLDSLKKVEIGARWKRKHKNAAINYLNDMEVCFSEMTNTLKKGKHLCIIIGESKKHLEKVNNHIISFLQNTIGLELVHSTSREISQKFFIHPSGGVKTEDILIFRRNKNG